MTDKTLHQNISITIPDGTHFDINTAVPGASYLLTELSKAICYATVAEDGTICTADPEAHAAEYLKKLGGSMFDYGGDGTAYMALCMAVDALKKYNSETLIGMYRRETAAKVKPFRNFIEYYAEEAEARAAEFDRMTTTVAAGLAKAGVPMQQFFEAIRIHCAQLAPQVKPNA